MTSRTVTPAILLAALVWATCAGATTWRVELNGSGDFTDIQPAVDAAAAGDTIRLGPGRFNTFRPIGIPGYFEEAIVWVTKPDLVFIGSGQDVTRVGTESYYGPYAKGPKAFYSSPSNNFKLRNMTLEHVKLLVHTGANVDVLNCRIRAFDPRNTCIQVSGSGSVRECEFDLAQAAGGISVIGSAHDFVVADCHFGGWSICDAINNGSGGVRNTTITDCTIDDGRIGFGLGSTGSISNTTISSSSVRCLLIADPASHVVLRDVVLEAPTVAPSAAISLWTSNLTGSRVTILNSRTNAIYTTGRCTITLEDSAILPATGFAVYASVASSWPTHTLDLRNNNWGTTDAARIAELIWDHSDDPSNPCTVLFEPFIGQPVGVEAMSWGDLKASFR